MLCYPILSVLYKSWWSLLDNTYGITVLSDKTLQGHLSSYVSHCKVILSSYIWRVTASNAIVASFYCYLTSKCTHRNVFKRHEYHIGEAASLTSDRIILFSYPNWGKDTWYGITHLSHMEPLDITISTVSPRWYPTRLRLVGYHLSRLYKSWYPMAPYGINV